MRNSPNKSRICVFRTFFSSTISEVWNFEWFPGDICVHFSAESPIWRFWGPLSCFGASIFKFSTHFTYVLTAVSGDDAHPGSTVLQVSQGASHYHFRTQSLPKPPYSNVQPIQSIFLPKSPETMSTRAIRFPTSPGELSRHHFRAQWLLKSPYSNFQPVQSIS